MPEPEKMRPRVHVVTLAVESLDRSLAFYRDGLGLPTKGIVGAEFLDDTTGASGAVVLFDLEDGLILALYPRNDLAKDAGLTVGASASGSLSLGQIVGSRGEVDALLERAVAAGAGRAGMPHARPWGIYSGYFTDPDGHLWEVICSPDGATP